LFREKPLPRKIDKFKLERLKISFADILKLQAGMDVVNEDGEFISNVDATLDPLPPRSYAYCSDTIFDPSIVSFISGVDLLYHESTFLKDHEKRAASTYHSTAGQAAQIAKMAGVKQLLLGHYSARYRNLELFQQEAELEFQPVLLASDGKKFTI
jgi:ribonuclease Z